jgi:hypothetical protein
MYKRVQIAPRSASEIERIFTDCGSISGGQVGQAAAMISPSRTRQAALSW